MGLEEGLYALVIGLREMIDIVLVLAILFLVVIILRIVEREFQIKLVLKRKDRNLFYRKELENLSGMNMSLEKTVSRANIIARDFFREAFNLPYNLEYSELIAQFRKIGNKECITFSKLISELNYSGEKITEKQVRILINLLARIIQKNKILSDEEKVKLEKKTKKEAVARESKERFAETFNKYSTFFGLVPRLKMFYGRIKVKIASVRVARGLRQ